MSYEDLVQRTKHHAYLTLKNIFPALTPHDLEYEESAGQLITIYPDAYWGDQDDRGHLTLTLTPNQEPSHGRPRYH
jgi:hypothetical protein